MRSCSLVMIFVLLSLICIAQHSGKITLTTYNEQDLPLENLTVELLKSSDSSLVKTAISAANGHVEFEQLAPGGYLLRVSGAGRITTYSQPVELTNAKPVAQLQSLHVLPNTGSLAGVTVTARKPFIQKLRDRIVVNVDNSIVSAGSSALDVLERSPGVNVDQNDVVSLLGRSGVVIMIDGKPTAMTGADLANYLRGLPSASIDRIDIITNPSAKYDAAGNSGIIDIHMKKDQRFGMNGTFTAGYGQGIYPKANTGTTFNYRNKKLNVFGNYNYAYRQNLNHLLLDRNFFTNGVYQGGDLKDNYSVSPFSSHTARAGLDYYASPKTIIGVVVNSNFNHITRENNNSSIVIDPQHQYTSTFRSLATNNDHGNNVVTNINFKHSFDSTGELTADVDYGVYNSRSLSVNATSYYKLNGESLQPDYRLDGNQRGKLTFITGKVDYSIQLNKVSRFEAGAKTSHVSSDNDARFFDVSSGTPVDDAGKTNHFLYKENNNAGYLNYSRDFKKFDLQVGLRGEHTGISTHQVKGDIHFDSSYFQLFPSAFFNYKMKADQVLGVSVSRRIDRPGYSQLNPFLFLIDVTTYATGMPGLLPQLTWSYEMNYTIKDINITLGYSHTKDYQDIAIARFKDVFPSFPVADNVTVQVPINLSSSDYYGITISAPVKLTKWWNMINNGNFYYNQYNGRLGVTQLDRGKPAVDIRTNNNFTFKKGWAAELNATFNSGGQAGFLVIDPRWGISTGVQKSILKNKGTVRFNMTDIFWTNQLKAIVTYDNYIEKWHAFRETRVANLSFTYRFGNNKVQAARRRTTASEEERQRAGN